jgi:hypothetical protein
MSDLEISKALALAIGWDKSRISIGIAGTSPGHQYLVVRPDGYKYGRPFNFLDWNVIGPIAAKYDCFPQKCCGEWSSMVATNSLTWVEADTPQKAIALAVIGAKK